MRSDTYRDRAKVRLERITVHVADNAAARANLYYAGECDVASYLPPSYVPLLFGRLEGHHKPRRDVGQTAWGEKMWVDLNNKKLSSLQLRRALARAIDRRQLRELFPGNLVPSRQFSLCHEAKEISDAELSRCGIGRAAADEICLLDDGHCYVPPPFPAHGPDEARRDLAAARQQMGAKFPASLTIRHPIQQETTRKLAIGVAYGALAGYAGTKVDEAMMRFVDVLYAFPLTAVVITVMAITDARGVGVLFPLIAAVSWLDIARITRARVQSLKRRGFVEAARALGVKPARILVRHVVPNLLGPVSAYAVLSVPFVMLTEAFLSFLGLGVQAPQASWGTLVAEGAERMLVYPWLLTGPAVVMSVTLLALNFFGDGLRVALDPSARVRPAA